MKYIIAALLTALTIGIAPQANAQVIDPVHTFKNGSMKLEKADRKVLKRKVTYVQDIDKGHRLYVELNSGATFDLVPCKFEDSRNCHWDAKVRGNTKGRSFIDIRGKMFKI